ncbi:MAG: RidA family protein [Rikenellaceae bacterium]
MCLKLVERSFSDSTTTIRMTFFGKPDSQEQYLERLGIISEVIAEKFGDKKPVFSYVSQPPLVGDLVLETVCTQKYGYFDINYKTLGDISYIQILFNGGKFVCVGGVMGSNILEQTIAQQCKEIFKKLDAILLAENLKVEDIVRQWNYIEHITSMNNGVQNYQSLNDERTHFYAKGDWSKGYPAATGIGTTCGGAVIDFDAMITNDVQIITLDNELQVPAHDYSQDVLLGLEDEVYKERTTPKFERGKAISSDSYTMSYISGTAAIRGEESIENMDIDRQIIVTMENINYLVSAKNLKKYGAKADIEDPQYSALRVYLKNESDIEATRKFMERNYPETDLCYLLADVCRDELLIEIEGIARY